jgi:hypothetical protein
MKNTFLEKLQYWYWSVVPYHWRPSNLWYKLKCKLWHKYTTIKPRYLDSTWHDRDMVLPHCIFEILSQFIEKECTPEIVEWYGEEGHKIVVNGTEKYVRDEMQELYDWWHQKYNKLYIEEEEKIWQKLETYLPEHTIFKLCYKNSWSKKQYKKYHKLLDILEATAQQELKENMHRLINIMDYMWT